MFVFAENHRAHRILFKVEREAESVAGELQHFALHRVRQTVNARDAVGEHDDAAFGARLRVYFKVRDARLDQFADLGGAQLDGHGFLSLKMSFVKMYVAKFHAIALRAERGRELPQSGAHRTVDHRIAGAHHRAADECGIHRKLQFYFAPEIFLQRA